MKKDIIFPLIIGTLIWIGVLIFGGYAFVEPSQADAATANTTVTVNLTVTEEISLTVADPSITMQPNITMSQDSSLGSTIWTVTTNSQAGYILKFTAAPTACGAKKALCDSSTGEGFNDVSTTTATVDWATDLSPNEYQFGYSVYGTDVSDTDWDGGNSSCGTAGADAYNPPSGMKFAGFATTTAEAKIAASSNSETTQAGTQTTLCVVAEQGDNVFAPDGSYSATITGTAVTQ